MFVAIVLRITKTGGTDGPFASTATNSVCEKVLAFKYNQISSQRYQGSQYSINPGTLCSLSCSGKPIL